MTFRIFRTYEWMQILVPSQMIHYGGPPDLMLQSRDELQMQTPEGDWIPIPIVEDKKPPYPGSK